ncbi:MAG: ATP-binding cassette domain-containing protein, partial [Mobilicoccus sp.]|nr:ATP-binding cassette domain-containing protein [Mobilicoccus sp.]
WWPTFFPGLMILITVLCLNVLSEGLTDALASPKVKPARDVEDEEAELRRAAAPTGPAATDAHDADVPTTSASSETPDQPGQTSAVRTLGVTDEASASRILTESLERLRTAELERGDRLVYPAAADTAPLLSVEHLSIAFPAAHGEVDIVDDVSFSVRPGEVMGLVGESGCGKSITSLAVMGLLPETARVRGRIMFDGDDLLTLSAKRRGALRGHDMAMIYQDALSSLNPSMLIRTQMAQLIRRGGTRTAPDLLEMVGLDPQRTLKSYPHELSGGQRQRVLIAMALTRNPRLVMADEPTTALDVTVQEQVVGLLQELREELGFAMVFVSHDLALVAKLAHRITVMYAGQVVEQGTTTELLTDPRHEYTRGLLGAVLSIESEADRLHQVPGTVPSPREFATGDRFAPRSLRPDADPDVRPHLLTLPGTTHAYATTQGGER